MPLKDQIEDQIQADINQNSEEHVEGDSGAVKTMLDKADKDNVDEKDMGKDCQSPTVTYDEPATNFDEKSLENFSFEETLERLRNFKPKRPVEPSSQFPDLSVEGETMARLKSHGSCHYWRMPFRHELFAKEMQNNDP